MMMHVLSCAKVYLITHMCIICDVKAKGRISGEEGHWQREKVWGRQQGRIKGGAQ